MLYGRGHEPCSGLLFFLLTMDHGAGSSQGIEAPLGAQNRGGFPVITVPGWLFLQKKSLEPKVSSASRAQNPGHSFLTLPGTSGGRQLWTRLP